MRFTKEHLWIKYNIESKSAECGISFYAQKGIGKIHEIDLPEIGEKVKSDQQFGKIETRTSTLKLFSPVDFEVVSVSSADQPGDTRTPS